MQESFYNRVLVINLCMLIYTYAATVLTSLYISSSGGVVFNGRRNSIAWQAASNSIAKTEWVKWKCYSLLKKKNVVMKINNY